MQGVRLLPGNMRQIIQIRNLFALQDLDDEMGRVGIDSLSDFCRMLFHSIDSSKSIAWCLMLT